MFIDEFQEKIWKDKYQYNNESFPEFCDRLSSNIFNNDSDIKYREDLYKDLMDFKLLFGGRVNANIGRKENGLTLFNCFIESIGKEPDSLIGIMDLATRYVMTLKTEGGVGFCANFLRPRGTIINKIGVTTPGSVKFLEIYDKLSEVITSGGVNGDKSYQGLPTKNSIRKGATMVTMSICHPDIEDFITAKSVPGRLMRMNMSVMVTDAFLYAVNNDLDWDLWFPDINCDQYDKEWNGDFEKWAENGYPTVTYNTVKAEKLWDLLLNNSYCRNEPGIMFIDNVRRMDNLFYLNKSSILGSNPCAEVMGSTGIIDIENGEKLVSDVCCLGSVNIVKFYDVNTSVFDIDGLLKSSTLMLRSLDNVIDVSSFPIQEYVDGARMKRKVGVGITGVGSLMMMMNMRYGSKECVDFLDNVLVKFMNALYKESAIIAKEKGPFELYDVKMLKGGYINNNDTLTDDTVSLIMNYGLRNSAVSAIAPNGTLSILAGNVSGGLEPVFSKEYTRWVRVEGQKVDFDYPDIHVGEWYETDYFKEQDINGDFYLLSTDGEYRIDKSNGLCKKSVLMDYGYRIAKEKGFNNTLGASELSIEDHLNVLSVFSKRIDQSSSKTINLPNDISFEEFKELYGKVHKFGVKGCTTYRKGTMVGVLEENNADIKKVKKEQKEFLDAFKDQKEGEIVQTVKLPTEYPAKGYILRAESRKWYVHVCFKDLAMTKPYAVFVNTNNREDNVSTFGALEKLAELSKSVGLNGGLLEEVQRKYTYQKNPVKICRMLGYLLRHNVDLYLIVKALDEVEEATVGTFVHRIKKFLYGFVETASVENKCPECGEKVILQEGCLICMNCGYSVCS